MKRKLCGILVAVSILSALTAFLPDTSFAPVIEAVDISPPFTNEEQKEFDELLAESRAISGSYSNSSWKRFQNAIRNAERASTTATKRSTYKELLSAKESLVYVGSLLKAIDRIPEDKSYYKSNQERQNAIDAKYSAKDALLREHIDQKEVDEVTRGLIEILSNLNISTSDITISTTPTLPTETVENSDLGNAWKEFIAMQSGNDYAGIKDKDSGGEGAFDTGTVIAISVIAALAIVAVAVSVILEKKDK